MSEHIETVEQALSDLCSFLGAMPFEIEDLKVVHAFQRVLENHPRKFKAVCEAICDEMASEDGDEEE